MKNDYRIDGDVAYIKLTQGKEAIIDVVDLSLIEDHRWYAANYRGRCYADAKKQNTTGTGPRQIGFKMHRVIMGDECTGLVVDHINGNALDNRRINLRAVNHSVNGFNTKRNAARPTYSGYRGVYKSGAGTWHAALTHEGKSHSLGTFHNPREAAFRWDMKALDVRGDFLQPDNLNFGALSVEMHQKIQAICNW